MLFSNNLLRHLLLAALVSAGWLHASAQGQTPSASPSPVDVSRLRENPSPTVPDNVRFLKKPGPFNACVARVAAQKGKPCDVLFIGDSITERWLNVGKDLWEKDYVPRHSLNFGGFGDKTQNVLWRLDNLDIKDLKPKVAVVLVGTNNTNNTAPDIAEGVKAVIARTQALYPGVKIILVSILPNQRAQDLMMAANAILRHCADDRTIFWLDLVALMPPVTTTAPDGKTDVNWKGLGTDHLHPDASGYKIWSDAMDPLLDRLLAGGGN